MSVGDRRVRAVTWTASVGFEVACLYAWAAFTLTLLHDRTYSLAQAVAAFSCGSLAAGWMRRSGLQVMDRAVVHSIGLLLLAPFAVRSALAPQSGSLLTLLSRSHELRDWLTVAVTLGWMSVLWFTGARHGRDNLSYETLCQRFDRAVGWLAELFVVKIVLRLQPGINLADGVAGAHVAAFVLFAVVAIASARSRGEAHKSFVGQSRGLGPLLGLGSGIFVCALALVLLFLPQLRAAAQAGFASLAPLAGPLGSVFTFIITALFMVCRFLIGPGWPSSWATERQNTAELTNEQPAPTWLQPARSSDIWPWLSAAVLSAIVLGLIGWIVWRNMRRTTAHTGVWRRLQQLWREIVLFVHDDRPEALRLYTQLTTWARRSGIEARPHETPLEFGARLRRHVPSVRAEIDAIVRALNLHLYAPTSQPLLTLRLERKALRRLRSPRLWPRRFKLWLLGDDERPDDATAH